MRFSNRIWWWLSRVLTIAAFVTGIIGNWSDILQTQSVLGLTWQQLSFLLFGIIVLAIIIELELRHNKLESAHPRIVVRPMVSDNKRLILEVINNGFGGDFSGKAKIQKGSPHTDSLDLQWEASGQVRCHIDGGGGEATLLVGTHLKHARLEIIEEQQIQKKYRRT